ncbi:TIGR03564 family F420-dependent LLM class oxidoreductase [Pseudonocardia ailaonensis]|uniref:TIGR03564 family F420-dependent LLM class oxidoreductase n=1 Tax=Pseudonocardia ailaonensis TaxID=367279 RepID=A0ABN2MLW8_9PSEU
MFGYLGGGVRVVDDYVATLAALRDEGFARYWTAQLPRDPDLLTVLAIGLREVPGIEVGTGVVPVQPQHPMALAQRALLVNQIGGGRLTLGLGLSHKPVVEGMWGQSFDRPVRRMSQVLDGLLPLLAGEKAAAEGDLVTTRGALAIEAPAPPVYLAALGPQMLRLAGRRTAGTVTWMTGPRTLAEHAVPTIRGAAEEAGRTVRVVASLPVAVTDDRDGARAEAARQFAVYGQLPSYRAMLDREGYAGPADAAIVGDETEVAERIAALREAGVDEYVALPFSPDPEERARTRALLRTL